MSVSRSIAWSMTGQIGGSAAALIATAILARLLTPVDYGAFAFATSIYAIVQWLLQMGLGAYVLRERELSPAKLDTVFAATLLQGLAAAAIVLVAAPLAGLFARSATVGWITAIVAIFPLLSAPEAVADALWLRRGRYSTVATLQIAKASMQLVVSVAAELLLHWHAFSLVAGLVANGLTSFVAASTSLYVRQGLRPRLDAESRAGLTAFSSRSLMLTLAQVGSTRMPDLLIGRLLSLAMLGQYSRAVGALDLIARTFSAAVQRAVAPRFFEQVREGRDLGEAVADLIDKMLFCCWIPVVGVAVIAAPLVHLIYGAQWNLAAHALPFLCLTFALDTARSGGMEVFVAHDRLGANTKLELCRAVYAIGLVVAGARWGLEGVLWARVVEAVVTFLLYMVAMNRFGALAMHLLWRVFAINALLSAAAALPAALLMARWGWPQQLPFGHFVLAIGAGAAGCLAMMAIVRHPFAASGAGMLRSRLSRRQGAQSTVGAE